MLYSALFLNLPSHFFRHIVHAFVVMLFSVFCATIAFAVPTNPSKITFSQTETTHFAQGADVGFTARSPPMAVSNVEVTGGVTVMQGSAFALHGQETVAALFGFKRSTIALNRTVSVDTSRATRGTPEYNLLNNPPENTRVELDNGTTFRTNEAGYVGEVSYQPVNQTGVRDSRQTAVGREGIAGDVGGHIQACRHGGTCDRFNLFPQNGNFNNSAYRTWENRITRSLQNGDDVGGITVRLERADPASARPDFVDIEFTINGVPERVRFPNQAGAGQ